MPPATLLLRAVMVGTLGAVAGAAYPMSYTSCGVAHELQASPQKVVTMNQGATEFMLAMGLEERMAGTAYLDDRIWPRYAEAYAGIPVLSAKYPNETEIMAVNPDFIVGSFGAAFREKVCTDRCRGIFGNATIGHCEGVGSDVFPSGSNANTSYSTCRPQLHAAGIGTWLDPLLCEDADLRPQGGANEQTVYDAITQMGKIFNVPTVAAQLIAEIRNDFDTATRAVQSTGHSISAVWLDSVVIPDPPHFFVGAGTGAPNLIMQESGLTNVFGDRSGGWTVVNVSDVLAADPDVVIVMDAMWSTALSKIDFLHNRIEFSGARFVQKAGYIKMPYSASTLGPRNGAAALDLANAAIHLNTGVASLDAQSGVDLFDPQVLAARTASLLTPVLLQNVRYCHVPTCKAAYPMSYTSCGVAHALQASPQRVVTMNQAATELMLAMGLEERMAGTAYLDDQIWPSYAATYARIPVLSSGYPSEEEIMAVNPDFIVSSFKAAFRERVCTDSCRGIFSNATIGHCEGVGSDFFPSGSNANTSYSTCRPQLHAAGIGTWLDPLSCEDADLSREGGATEHRVYETITQMGKIFNVPTVAAQLIAEIRNEFHVAERAVQSSGHNISAVWLDSVINPDIPQFFVGAGTGVPNLIMQESGLTNVFGDRSGSWTVVNVSDVLAADPDVVIIVDAKWNSALSKIDFLHNRSEFSGSRFVQKAGYIKMPFSAATLGPRNGAAALDMANAAIHVTTGAASLNAKSGVDFFDPQVLAARTASLLTPVVLENVRYCPVPTCRAAYPMSYTSCGVAHALQVSPQRVVTMNQGATEFMLAMGLERRMAGTAYLDDQIWPRYAAAYAEIPVLASGYPSEKEIMAVNPDFIVGSYGSAFREQVSGRGIFSSTIIGPCEGVGSDFFPSGSNATTSYSTCRPQLHAAGIGTWLEPTSCEDGDLRPQGDATEQTVYHAITQMGEIFNMPTVAAQLIAEIRNEFDAAKRAVQSSGHKISAVWLDSVINADPPQFLVGTGAGAPNLIMQESGLTNLFGDRSESLMLVDMSDVLAADPDVVIIVDAVWSTALSKIDFLHNRSEFSDARFVQKAHYIKIPLSASTLGPRNGAAALDIANAAIRVTTGAASLNAKSGVDSFDPQVLAARTSSLLLPVDVEKIRYSASYRAPGAAYPMSYTSCGVAHRLQAGPLRAVTMNQGATEFMLAMGLEGRMAGTAYLDDQIWPRYAAAYAKIPVLSSGYPSEEEIMAVNPDFIVGSYRSAFREKVCTDRCRGIFSSATIGHCEGAGSDFFPSGSNASTSYSTCRPQLHAAGIGTWLEPPSCEDADLRPQGGATEQTVYDAITQMGEIFNVPTVAAQLVAEIRNDFAIAERAVQNSGHSISAVWLDCVGRCCKDANGNPDPLQFYVGAGTGAPNLIMDESGLTNLFGDRSGSWTCVNVSDVLAADPDLMIIVDAAWDTALSKIVFLHNHSESSGAGFAQKAAYIKIPFSASTLGPRNGAAALDMAAAAIHVTTGAITMNAKSGVDFFDPQVLADQTAKLLFPVDPEKVPYSATYKPASNDGPTPGSGGPSSSPPTGVEGQGVLSPQASNNDLPVWAVVLIAVLAVLVVAVLAFVCVMYRREKQGKPIFESFLQNRTPEGEANEARVLGSADV